MREKTDRANRLALGCLAIACAWLPLQAERINEAEARLIAGQFLSPTGTHAALLRSMPKSQAQERYADYYVFNQEGGEGFVIVAGDDSAYPILGYSHKGTIDYDHAPAQLQAWLDGYAQEIRYLRRQAPAATRADEEAAGYTPVQPLLGDIAWDQLEPYNGMTPCYVGTTHSATGCVATAMAQIMYYHRWPAQGTGSHYYTPVGWNTEIGADFSQSVYDWEAMLPQYDTNSPQQAKDAVALLMRDCGYAVNMVYGEQSGSNIEEWPVPLTVNFGYDPGIGLLKRQYYTQEEWDGIIRAEIDAGRPVFSTGFTESSGGHAYVFDGYDADGLIHVNWGWSGMANGYFRTSALTPATQGTGGSAGGFNYRQGIIIGIQPPTGTSEPHLQIVSSERMKETPSTGGQVEPVTLRLTGKVTNYGWQAVTVDFGFGVFDASDSLVLVAEADKAGVELAVEDYAIGLTASDVSFASLPDGQYELWPVARNTGGKQWSRVRDYNYKKKNRLNLTVQDGELTFETPDTYRLVASSLQSTALYRNTSARIAATLANEGGTEYNGGIRAALLDPTDGRLVDESAEYIQDILPDETKPVEIIATFTTDSGAYELVLLDEDSHQLCEPVGVELQEAPESAGVLQLDEALSFPDNGAVSPDSMALTARLTCTDGVFAGDLLIYLYDATGTTVVGSFDPQFVFAEAGESMSVRFTASFENGVPGTTYRAVLTQLAYGSAIPPADFSTCTFTLAGDASGLTAVSDATPADGTVYTLQGVPVRRDGSLEGLPAGIYIVNGTKQVVK